MKKYWLVEDIKWCGIVVLHKGQEVYDMGAGAAANPETRSCQTYVLKQLLRENPSQIS